MRTRDSIILRESPFTARDRNRNHTEIYRTINGERREIVIELPDESVRRITRDWTPGQRLAAGAYLNRKVRGEIVASVAALHPDWSSEQVGREVARRFMSGDVGDDRYLTLAEALELDEQFRARKADNPTG